MRASPSRPVAIRPAGAPRGRLDDVAAGTPGTIIGVFEDSVLIDRAIDLGMGDSLVLYTDGVTDERRNSDAFGEVRLHEALSELAGAGATDRRRRRRRRGRFPERPPRDDIAILTTRWSDDEPRATLEPVPDSIPQARQTLDRLADAVEEPLLENLRLLVSEVVTNSIRHGEGSTRSSSASRCARWSSGSRSKIAAPGSSRQLADDDGERSLDGACCSSTVWPLGGAWSRTRRTPSGRARTPLASVGR